MKMKGCKITMLLSERGLDLELHDDESAVCFLRATLAPEQVCSAFGRLAHVKLDSCEVHGLEKLNKKMEWKKLDFPIGDCSCEDREEVAIKKSLKYVPEGWKSDDYYHSQGSFYSVGKENWASVTIRRWV